MKSVSMRRQVAAAALLAGMALAGPGLAEGGYRLVAGDALRVSLTAQGQNSEIAVDIDGQIRLPEAGAVAVAGLTLDEAERSIGARLEEAGLLIDPQVSVSLQGYAPVVVAGEVARPGSYPYVPGMTVEAAVAMAGGSQSAGLNRLDVDRARIEAEGQLRLLNLDLAARATRAARLLAQLEDRPEVELTETLRRAVPHPDTVDLARMLEGEQDILTGYRARRDEMLGFWEVEIASIEQQAALYDQRMAVQEEVLAKVAEDLASARQLQERGLQTANRLLSAEQREATARADLLALQASRISAAQAISDARRARAQFLLIQRNEAMSAIQAERVALDELQLRYARTLEALALLSGGGIGTLLASDAIAVVFEILGPRDGREAMQGVTRHASILPGETLIVSVEPAAMSVSN